MRILTCICASLGLFTILSCQKTVEWVNSPIATGGGGGGVVLPALLSKVVSKTGSDSLVETFTYDASGKVVTHTTKGKSLGAVTDNEKTFARDAQGRITTVTEISLNGTGGKDTSTTNIYYSATVANRVAYTIGVSKPGGIPYRDSSVYMYSGNNVNKITSYLYNASAGTYSAFKEAAYIHDANNNVVNVKEFNITGTSPALMMERKYSYDLKKNPLQLGYESVLAEMETFSGANNGLTVEVLDFGSGAATMNSSRSLSYRSNNTPATGLGALTKGSVTISGSVTFSYQ